MCGERRNVRTVLYLTCHLLWMVGVAVGLSGVYLLMKYRENSLFFSQIYITLPGIFAISSAVSLFFTGCFGLWISFRNSPCLQGLFVFLLVVGFCLESTTSALAYFHSTKLDSETAPVRDLFQKYTGKSQDLDSRAVDTTQYKFQCCGVSNYTDWMKTSWFNQTGDILVPRTCCNSSFPSCNGTVNEPWKLYPQGCQVKLEMTFQFILNFIIWGFLLVFLIEVVLFLTVAQLMKKHQSERRFYHTLD